DAFTLFAAADLVPAGRVRNRREELVVLAEPEVLEPGAGGERHAVEVDDEAAAGSARDVLRVDGEAVGEVEHRGRARGQRASPGKRERGADVAVRPERGAGRAERAGDDEPVAGLRAASPGHALGAAEGGDRERHLLGPRGVAADHRHVGLGHALVEREHVLDDRVGGEREAHDEPFGHGAGGGEVAEVDRGGPPGGQRGPLAKAYAGRCAAAVSVLRRVAHAVRRSPSAASTAARNARSSATARMTATPAAPARMQSAAFEASTPPIAITGAETAPQIAASPRRPS